MKSGALRKKIWFACLAGVMSLLLCGAAGAAQTQKDWMISLIDACGWSFGLPDKPQTADYLAILNGTRLLRIEAETAKRDLDSVSVQSFRTFGDFSGSGWVNGMATPTRAHLEFLLPIAGSYRLTASLRLAGFRFHVAGQTLNADGGRSFSRVELGTVELAAGLQEVVVEIPPNASLDYLELEGEHSRRIVPTGGWQPDQPLTAEVMAVTTLQILDFEYLLPLSDETLSIEAEVVGVSDRARVVSSRHLGLPSGGKWLRMGAGNARIELPLTLERGGMYKIDLRAAASRPLRVTINGRFEQLVTFPPYLETRSIGSFRLHPDVNRISVEVPSRAGIDQLLVRRHSDAEADYLRLAGLNDSSGPLDKAADNLLRILATLDTPR